MTNETTEDVTEAVLHPSHYEGCEGIECIDAIHATLGDDRFIDFCTANAIKYLWRWRDKGGSQDLAKAHVYTGWAVDVAESIEDR